MSGHESPVGLITAGCTGGGITHAATTQWVDPRKALRGVISKVDFNQVCQLLITISHKMAPRTRQSEAGITPRRAFCGQWACQEMSEEGGGLKYRGASLIRNTNPVGPCSSPMPRKLW